MYKFTNDIKTDLIIGNQFRDHNRIVFEYLILYRTATGVIAVLLSFLNISKIGLAHGR